MYELIITKPVVRFSQSTTDFLQVVCDIANATGPNVAGNVLTGLLNEKEDELNFMRITEWNFTWVGENLTIDIRKLA